LTKLKGGNFFETQSIMAFYVLIIYSLITHHYRPRQTVTDFRVVYCKLHCIHTVVYIETVIGQK